MSTTPNTIQVRKDLICDKGLSFYDKGVFCFLCLNAGEPKNIESFDPREARKFAESVRRLIKLKYIIMPGRSK